MGRVRTADLVLLVSVALWGLNAAITKYAFGHGFLPLSWAALRFTIVTVIFVAVALVRFGVFRLSREEMFRLAIWGGLVFATNQIGFSYSLKFASAATVALLFGTLPLFAGLFSELLGIERLGGLRWTAAMVSFAGIALVAIGATTGLHASVGGILLSLYAPAAFALYSIMMAPLVRRHGTLKVNTIASLFCLPVLLSASVPDLASTDWGAVTGLAWLCLAFSATTYVPTNLLWLSAVDEVGSRAGLDLRQPAAVLRRALRRSPALRGDRHAPVDRRHRDRRRHRPLTGADEGGGAAGARHDGAARVRGSGARVRAEAPEVALRIADGEAAGAVVLVHEAAHELGARARRPFEEAVGVLADDVGGLGTGLPATERRVVLARRSEHDPAAERPAQLGVLDHVRVVVSRVDRALLEPEGVDEERDRGAGVAVGEARPDSWVGCACVLIPSGSLAVRGLVLEGWKILEAMSWPGAQPASSTKSRVRCAWSK